MKYILLFLALALNSCKCENSCTKAGYTVTSIESYSDSEVIYHSDYWKPIGVVYLDPDNPRFVAKKGLYNIGDTIKFTK